jgi:SAM-dependent methyltransferase
MIFLSHMPLSTAVLRQRLGGQQWTSHNIRLSEEITTMPGQPDFLETDLRLHAVLRILRLVFGENLAGLRIADLGCLEGGFSLALAQRGARVTGIEARAKNLEKALLLKQHFDLPHLDFVLGDVKAFSREAFGEFDAVLALGILYHLDRPVHWLRQIGAAVRKVLIADTHYAPATDAELALIDRRIAALGPLEQMDVGGWNCVGRWFSEYGEGVDPEPQLWASYSNRSSFWLTKESLLLALLQAGFPLVLEQHDYSAERYQFFTSKYPRTILVAIK